MLPVKLLNAVFRTEGGFVSVALSLESLPVAVSNCLVLCCPDFPPAEAGDHLVI